MSINRNSFLEAFARSSPSLNLIFMNHAGAPATLLANISAIEILVDKKSTEAFIAYCKTHPLTKELTVSPQYRKTNILVEFLDGSELNFRLITNMVRKTMLCLKVNEIRKAANVNEFGMLVPSIEHHFEYMILKNQFGKDNLPDRYKNFFGTYDPASRAVIFKYLQSRFNLVFNTLEDLYTPKPNMLLTIMIGLRSERENTLIRMFFRSIEITFHKFFGWLTNKPIHIVATPQHAPEFPNKEKTQSAGQAML
ncbi:MAG: hypothetical protein M3Q95_08345 [Bacteroidota bacterium]|nr:hypothetical protein [Bacteroidota bacterium]